MNEMISRLQRTDQQFTYKMKWVYLNYVYSFLIPFVFLGLFALNPSKFVVSYLWIWILVVYYGVLTYSLFYTLLKVPSAITISESNVCFQYALNKVIRWKISDLQPVTIKIGFIIKPFRRALKFQNIATGKIIYARENPQQGIELLTQSLKEAGVEFI